MPQGVLCPRCSSHLHEVVQTLKDANVVIRIRKCFNGHRFNTEERPVSVRKHKREKVQQRVLGLLKKREKDSALTVAVIASMVGVSVDTVYRIQRGEGLKRSYR